MTYNDYTKAIDCNNLTIVRLISRMMFLKTTGEKINARRLNNKIKRLEQENHVYRQAKFAIFCKAMNDPKTKIIWNIKA